MTFPSPFLCIWFLSSLPMLLGAQNNTNITLNSTLTAGNVSESPWVSQSGDFAFGFQPVAGSGGFLLTIWYNKIPDKTVTWSANRDELAQQGSKLNLTVDGLVLSDPKGKVTWSTSTGIGRVAYAEMLDIGNLVLANESQSTLWQSFDAPTDTVLPTQILNTGSSLIAQLSSTNYSRGRFKLEMQTDGNLVLYTTNWPQDSFKYSPYFSTGSQGSEYQMVFENYGYLHVTDKNMTNIKEVFLYGKDPKNDFYKRAILEFDGVFRFYDYPRSNSTNQPMKWTVRDSVPANICNQTSTSGLGGGACGFNSLCKIGDDKRPNCWCPTGYLLFDEADKLRGCKQDFIAQSCLEGPQKDDQFVFTKMETADFTNVDYEAFFNMSEIECQNSCLFDCLCAAAVYLPDMKCWKKRFPLSNGIVGSDLRSIAFIKMGVDNSMLNPEPDQPNRTMPLIEKLSLGSSVFLTILLLTLAVFTLTICRRKRIIKIIKSQENQDIAGTNLRSFSYGELEEATSGFKEVIGQGAFATVYKGALDSEEGKVVAVKKLNESINENQREFESEVKAIAITGHRNLVQLIGFCNEEQHRLLVYEYMPNGSIADVLFRGQRLNWLRRIRFAFDIARGLNYLHDECSIQIIHCDIKPQNVLLDDSFTARISDFGLAKLLKKDQTHTLTGIRGTKGYVAPEWFRSMAITTKADVFSYGILMLEIICCRRCFVADMEDESQMVLADWAYDCYKEERIDKLVEDDDEALTDIEKVKKLVMVGLWCIQEDPSHRPSMNKVVEMIKGALEEPSSDDLVPHISSP